MNLITFKDHFRVVKKKLVHLTYQYYLFVAKCIVAQVCDATKALFVFHCLAQKVLFYNYYSVLKLFTGLALAAFNVCILIKNPVTKASNKIDTMNGIAVMSIL